ncbi:unnamed protein product [Caenorhabditis auriculariae]|uniref:Uncharacterized protein n=1 Tax=Caenorhabditis auriculariae TaxID=2777116 RepID=A0A8S1HNX3_9PELO|nr:unnamed protein product [Caenorhabditis auriculariae]
MEIPYHGAHMNKKFADQNCPAGGQARLVRRLVRGPTHHHIGPGLGEASSGSYRMKGKRRATAAMEQQRGKWPNDSKLMVFIGSQTLSTRSAAAAGAEERRRVICSEGVGRGRRDSLFIESMPPRAKYCESGCENDWRKEAEFSTVSKFEVTIVEAPPNFIRQPQPTVSGMPRGEERGGSGKMFVEAQEKQRPTSLDSNSAGVSRLAALFPVLRRMETKRRSAEEEQELDRKIALIREKNLKIEQRTKEIAEDRARNEDSPSKTPKSAQDSQPKRKSSQENGKWDREWDHGKTPAETWRENVPPMDLKNRLAGRGGALGASGGAHRGRGAQRGGAPKEHREPREGRHNGNNSPKLPANLEGRVTMPTTGVNGRSQPRQNRGGRRNGGTQREVAVRGEKVVVSLRTSAEGEKPEKTKPHKGAAVPGKESKENPRNGKPRPRRESDGYAVKKVVRRLIDDVCKMEKQLKRRERQNLIVEDAEEEKDQDAAQKPSEVVEEKTSVLAEQKPTEESKVEDQAVENGAKEEEEVKKTEADANQNVITLVPEKVAILELSSA